VRLPSARAKESLLTTVAVMEEGGADDEIDDGLAYQRKKKEGPDEQGEDELAEPAQAAAKPSAKRKDGEKSGQTRKRKGSADHDALAALKRWIALKYPTSTLADPSTCDAALSTWCVVDKPRQGSRHVDRYYLTESGKMLRSRPEAVRHLGLEHGPPAPGDRASTAGGKAKPKAKSAPPAPAAPAAIAGAAAASAPASGDAPAVGARMPHALDDAPEPLSQHPIDSDDDDDDCNDNLMGF
jgi:hypothetical protein